VETQAISTGEARIDPADAAQDEADEAAETAARVSDKPTLEDLRRVVARYAEKFGAKAGIENIRSIIGCALIEVPEAGIPAAISRVEAAIGGSTVLGIAGGVLKGGEIVVDDPMGVNEAPTATKAEVVAALTLYGKKYDGVVDPAKMLITREDMPKVLEELFGAGIKTVPAIPQTPEAYGRAKAAIEAATRDNPFKREVKA
jgi:hypothetical protein